MLLRSPGVRATMHCCTAPPFFKAGAKQVGGSQQIVGNGRFHR
ncbi:MAG: hypothetical protein M5U34_35620 [Chloroflexi bacterium]|nr:hypothetical protein [Chloroflexota bacterium]